MKNDSVWVGGNQTHQNHIIKAGRKKIEALLTQISVTESEAEQEKLKMEIEKVKLEMGNKLKGIDGNLY